jgi:hypothetical protein
MQVRWDPTHGEPQDQPSDLLAPALPLVRDINMVGDINNEKHQSSLSLKKLLTLEVISTPKLTGAVKRPVQRLVRP